MAVFKVETKNKVDIDKKPRVYFTCHPEDFEKYFKKVCEDIFKTHDCAIYYTEDMTEIIAEDEKQVDLGRNNLFVVPVTFKLLTTPNRAMDEDVPFALKEHIPVLPIMMEPGIVELYSNPDKFGELQYLNPYRTDLTEISYEEKLKKYLESVLISDELAKRVRAAFDAYIFLSYRKKDRKYANELMRLIHSNPECRDIAIWFDEFLTPGESFKENIEKILDDCKLFTLLVTPQLLEKVVDKNGEERDNYVISTELPLARKKKQEKGTDIFAVEMEKTDRKALSAISIEDYTNPENADFRARLLETISRMAITTNNSPEHNFLIGLAYLEGIDVEVDRERGVELIASAARSGLREAIKKMALLYQMMQIPCAPNDLRKNTIYWQCRLVASYSKVYKNNPIYLDEYLSEIDQLVQLYKSNYFSHAGISQISEELVKVWQNSKFDLLSAMIQHDKKKFTPIRIYALLKLKEKLLRKNNQEQIELLATTYCQLGAFTSCEKYYVKALDLCSNSFEASNEHLLNTCLFIIKDLLRKKDHFFNTKKIDKIFMLLEQLKDTSLKTNDYNLIGAIILVYAELAKCSSKKKSKQHKEIISSLYGLMDNYHDLIYNEIMNAQSNIFDIVWIVHNIDKMILNLIPNDTKAASFVSSLLGTCKKQLDLLICDYSKTNNISYFQKICEMFACVSQMLHSQNIPQEFSMYVGKYVDFVKQNIASNKSNKNYSRIAFAIVSKTDYYLKQNPVIEQLLIDICTDEMLFVVDLIDETNIKEVVFSLKKVISNINTTNKLLAYQYMVQLINLHNDPQYCQVLSNYEIVMLYLKCYLITKDNSYLKTALPIVQSEKGERSLHSMLFRDENDLFSFTSKDWCNIEQLILKELEKKQV